MNLDIKTYTYKEANTGRIVVKAVTTYCGKTVCAYAKCDPVDTFDEKFGKDVAELRLRSKILKKSSKGFKARAKACDENIKWCRNELKLLKKTKDRASATAIDRLVEAKEIDDHIKSLLETIN